ncbi:MAG: exo-alpha-sialidase [Planctomycetes bacterium]|nr:exo-alpha-sialidase [Planctomycetota bacterium]
MADGQDWSFLNGPWKDGPEGGLVPPDGGGKEYTAVWHRHEYSDFQARFRFKFRYPHGGARFLLRLQDSTRYYALDIPWSGQQNRNRHFWAGIVLADGTPLQRYLNLRMIPGICPQQNRWYEGRVEASGPRLRAWIEGRPVADLEDRTYASGRVGFMGVITTSGNQTPHFADFLVEGSPVSPSPWGGLQPPPKHWITPCREVDPESFQGYPNLIRSRSGDLTLSVPFGNPNLGEVRRSIWVRSRDGGRTWSDPEPATLPQGFGASIVKKDGTWMCVHCKASGPVEEAMHAFESRDEGRSWSGPKSLNVRGAWPKDFSLPVIPSGRPLRLHDGALLVPVYTQVTHPPTFNKVSTNFVFRSIDDGETWEAPVRCDSNNWPSGGDRWFCPADLSEIGLAETEDGVVMGFGRPGPWPTLWQVQSNDGGRTWQPASFGPFPGYCITLTRLSSGALIATHRFPYLTANVSTDGGLTWDAGTIIDYPLWANQHALEVEPEVLLVVTMGHIVQPGQADIRAFRLRLTPRGLVLDS